MGGCASREEEFDDGADFPRRGYDHDEPTLNGNFTPVGPSFPGPMSPLPPGSPMPLSPIGNGGSNQPPPPSDAVYSRLTRELGYDAVTVANAFKALELNGYPITVETAVSYISGESNLELSTQNTSVSPLSPIPNVQFVEAREATAAARANQHPLSGLRSPSRANAPQLTPFQQQWELPDPKTVPNAHLIIQDTPQPLLVVAELLRNMGYDPQFALETARTEAPQRELWSVSDLLGMVIHKQALRNAELAAATAHERSSSPQGAPQTSNGLQVPDSSGAVNSGTQPDSPNRTTPGHAKSAPQTRSTSNFSLGSMSDAASSHAAGDTSPLIRGSNSGFAVPAGLDGRKGSGAHGNAVSEETPMSPLAAAAEEDCKVCFASKVDSVLVPCGHAVLCHACAAKLQYEGIGCPVCRAKVAMAVRVKGSA
ncbi:hypothetical protein HDU93_003027 [Gonapodya sp. JEL0774]|nr:hypothetical protein HDU93_003027 [Gonapodya sp. JEL0774]